MRSTIGEARGYLGDPAGRFFSPNVTLESSSVQGLVGAAFGATLRASNTFDVPGEPDQDSLYESVRYLPRAEPGSVLEDRTANLLYFRGRSDTFYGDAGYDAATLERRWPVHGEDIIARNMRSYDNPDALAVGGGTIHVRGDRGAAAGDETLSEYIWGYIDAHIPPLVVRVKNKGSYHRIAWEHHGSHRRDAVTGWRVVCMDGAPETVADLPESQLVHNDESGCGSYAVHAGYADGVSGVGYIEVPE